MTADEYVRDALSRHPSRVSAATAEQIRRDFEGLFGASIPLSTLGVQLSGSMAKGTVVGGGTDLDLFVSVSERVVKGLQKIYDETLAILGAAGISGSAQNVSVGVTYRGLKVDVVPGRRQGAVTNDHSLWRRRAGTWQQTNVAEHIRIVRASGRIEEIRAIKLWRQLHGLDFPSFYLELTVLDSLAGARLGPVGDNVWRALGHIAERLPTRRLLDPANAANVVSDDLPAGQKVAVAAAAKRTLDARDWSRVIW